MPSLPNPGTFPVKLLEKKLVFPNPPGASTAYEYEYYSKPAGTEKIRLRFLDISNDIFDDGSLSFSSDNGRTWRDQRPNVVGKKTTGGTLRRFECIGFTDPVENKLITLYLEGLFKHDDLLEGVSQYYVNYRVSDDGGRTSLVDERIIQKGGDASGAYDAHHPFKDTWVGKNAIMLPLIPPIVRTKQGHLCLIVSRSLLGPDGKSYNPGGGFTWLEEMVLIGRWQKGGRIEWEPVAGLSLPPTKSTRGLDECTLAERPDGTLLLVMRGSNDAEGKIPGHKWFATSRDAGFTWSEIRPWGYADGSLFFSSASMCQLLPHSNGKLYWLGNISAENARANLPRDIFSISEVDPRSHLLKKDTLFIIDRAQPQDPPDTQLSNFAAHEDRQTGEIIVNVPYFTNPGGGWVGDTYRYRVGV